MWLMLMQNRESEKMLVLGLTGQSGAGKGVFSAVALKNEKIAVLDTDKTAREVVQKGQPCLEELTRCFSCEILNDDGTLNRRKLASIAFCDESKHCLLNKITHSYIMEKIEQWVKECEMQGKKCAVIDAPLLFESGADKLCDMTLGIIAPYEIRLERIMSRDGIDEKNAKIRLDSQPKDEFFIEKCTHILKNDASADEFEKKAQQFINDTLLSRI